MNKKWQQINEIGFVCLVLCLPVTAVFAHPGDGSGPGHEGRMQQKEQQREIRQAARAQRIEQRDQREQRGESHADGQRRPGRLTPEERRDLRRQINEAGQDLYQSQPKN